VIQQNASASEELAATSEELSAQSNVLQETISFFKVEEGGTSKRANVASKPLQKAKVAHIATGGAKPARAIGGEIKKKGVALDMGQGGKDEEDSEFERY
jgi:methyl-accepting chemotaxis protein